MKKSFRSLITFPLCLIIVLAFEIQSSASVTVEDIKIGADKGDAEAQYLLGVAYLNGWEVEQNPSVAVKWLYKSAQKGNAKAQVQIGTLLETGEVLPLNIDEAVSWYRKAANQDNLYAQQMLGMIYLLGRGVPKNVSESMRWFRKAAEQGDDSAQMVLGAIYSGGNGVLKDEIEALAWFNVAAVTGSQEAITYRGALEDRLGPQLSIKAQQRAKQILNELEADRQTRTKASESNKNRRNKTEQKFSLKSSGTGAFVTSDGLILTAAHVLGKSQDCKILTNSGLRLASVVKIDIVNDLALLKCEGHFRPVPVKSSGEVMLGQTVFTIGFPNIGLQGYSPKFTKGEISSLSGFQDDPRHWQISVPVQPGNSGGPIFDEAGNIVGVVLAKLDALKVAKVTGDLSQNVNYGIKGIYALPLIEGYSLSEPLPVKSPVKLEEVVEKVQSAVVLILVY